MTGKMVKCKECIRGELHLASSVCASSDKETGKIIYISRFVCDNCGKNKEIKNE